MAGENETGTGGSEFGTSGFGSDALRGSSTLQDSGTLQDSEQQGRVREAANELRDRARESGRDLIDQAVEKKDELKARASTIADDGRHRAADRAGTLARALHDTADNLDNQGDRQLSRWVHQAADQVDRMVGYLNGHDAGGLMRDMEDLARRNPALFLGGTYAAGMVLGRFLRASSPERRDRYHEDLRYSDDEHLDTGEQYGTLERTAEQHWPGSTSDAGETERAGAETGSSWSGVGVSRDSFASGHTTGGRTDETLRRGQDLGGTPGYGASSGMGSSGMGSSGMGSSGMGSSGLADVGRSSGSGSFADMTPRTPDDMSGSSSLRRGSMERNMGEPDAGLTDEGKRAARHDTNDDREREV